MEINPNKKHISITEILSPIIRLEHTGDNTRIIKHPLTTTQLIRPQHHKKIPPNPHLNRSKIITLNLHPIIANSLRI